MSIDKIKEDIIAMSKEFDEKDGCVTCELSIHKDSIDDFVKFVTENTDIKLGNWVLYECETCVGYHGEGYIHASIESTGFFKWFNQSQLIKIV